MVVERIKKNPVTIERIKKNPVSRPHLPPRLGWSLVMCALSLTTSRHLSCIEAARSFGMRMGSESVSNRVSARTLMTACLLPSLSTTFSFPRTRRPSRASDRIEDPVRFGHLHVFLNSDFQTNFFHGMDNLNLYRWYQGLGVGREDERQRGR